MKIKSRTWLIFTCMALLSIAVWIRYSYPRFSSIDLSVNRDKALTIAEQFLIEEYSFNPSNYKHAIVFISDDRADSYLQKTLGIEGEHDFLKKHDYELFFWVIRFYQENKKEEFRLTVSASTGQITSFKHIIEDTEARETPERDIAKQRAQDFLRKTFDIDFANYTMEGDLSKKYDDRTDYSFSWKKNDVEIPWSEEKDAGTAKLATGARIAGDEIIAFSKFNLIIPEKFNRSIEKQKQIGEILSSIFRIFSIILLTGSVFFVVSRRNHLSMHLAKKFIAALAAVLFILNLAYSFNLFQTILFNYPTTSSFRAYLWQHMINLIISSFYACLGILLPGLAGEALHQEVFPEKKEGAFLHYLLSSFFSKPIFESVVLGYLVAIILLGTQSIIFHLGHKYLGVWTEFDWVSQLSTSYFPFLTAIIISFRASFMEEILFRIFAISWGKMLFKSTVMAAVVASILWGFGHTNYLIFPMWFRGLEVTFIGLMISWVYLKYGIIPTVVAHFLFDSFWTTIGLFLGRPEPLHFYTSLAVLFLPLALGIIAFCLNRPEKEQEMRWNLNRHQIYNIDVLTNYLKEKGPLDEEAQKKLRQELLSHYWDVAVIEEALRRINQRT